MLNNFLYQHPFDFYQSVFYIFFFLQCIPTAEASCTCSLVLYSNKFEVGNLLKEREGEKYFIILPHAPPTPHPPAVRVEEEQKEGLDAHMEGEKPK